MWLNLSKTYSNFTNGPLLFAQCPLQNIFLWDLKMLPTFETQHIYEEDENLTQSPKLFQAEHFKP